MSYFSFWSFTQNGNLPVSAGRWGGCRPSPTSSQCAKVVMLIAPQYVRPFVKRHKNDRADAEAIIIAARQPEMRFVEPKTAEQQAKAVLFRSRERLDHQRTELVNVLRAVFYEYGHVIAKWIGKLGHARDIVEEPNSDLPELVREECRDLLEQIAEKSNRIDEKAMKVKKLATETDKARCLQTMPVSVP